MVCMCVFRVCVHVSWQPAPGRHPGNPDPSAGRQTIERALERFLGLRIHLRAEVHEAQVEPAVEAVAALL